MAVDSHYIPAFSIEDVLLDKDTGAPLSGGIVTFYRSLQPNVLKPVYQVTGTDPNFTYTQLPNPMILSSIGTFVDSMGNPVIPYFLPYTGTGAPDFGDVDYYRVVVTSAGLVPQFIRDPVPYVPGAGMMDMGSLLNNEIANPQFAVINFPGPGPYTFQYSTPVNVVTNIAPNWDIVVSGAGMASVTLTQLTPTGTLNDVTNPGTILHINSTGVSRLLLRQTIYGSPNLWGKGFLSVSFVGKTFNGVLNQVSMLYSQSDGVLNTTPVTLISDSFPADDTYKVFTGSVNIPSSTSINTFPNAHVDIYFVLPINIEVDITSVMVAATGLNEIDNISYEQTTFDRQVDQLYHYAYPIVPVGTIIDFFGFNVPLHYLPCNFALLNRITYSQLFNTITHTETVTLTMSSATFTVADGTIYSAGYGVEGIGIPAGTTIINVTMNTVTISSPATSFGGTLLRFFAAGNILQESVSLTYTVNTFTVADGTLYHVGEAVVGNGIPANTVISNIAVNTITISNPASATVTSLLYFYDPANGDGSTTFNAPDARRRSTIGSGGTVLSLPFPAGFGIGNQFGNVGGQELHKMVEAEVAPHTHGYTFIGGSGSSGFGAGGFTQVTLQTGTGTGTATPFNVIQPGLVTNKCIRYQ